MYYNTIDCKVPLSRVFSFSSLYYDDTIIVYSANIVYITNIVETLHNECCIFHCIAFFATPPPVIA